MSTYFLCGHDPRWDHRQIQDGITARLPRSTHLTMKRNFDFAGISNRFGPLLG